MKKRKIINKKRSPFDIILDITVFVFVISLLLWAICSETTAVIAISKNYSKTITVLSIVTIILSAITIIGMVSFFVMDKPSFKKKLFSRNLPSDTVDQMSGEQFEKYVADQLYDAEWSNISLTPASSDHGVDIIAVHEGKKYAIQCKRYKYAVNTKAIQEVYTGRGFYDADFAVVITNSTSEYRL